MLGVGHSSGAISHQVVVGGRWAAWPASGEGGATCKTRQLRLWM
jgi:hypothetical protein